MGSIEKRISKVGDITYRARVKQTGLPDRSATFPRLAEARRWVEEQERLIREGRYFERVEASRHTLGEAIDKYVAEVSTAGFYGWKFHDHYLHWFRKELGHLPLSQVTPAVLSECKQKLLTTPLKNGNMRKGATANRHMSALSAVFQAASREWMWTDTNPVRRVRREKEAPGRVRFLSDEEREALLKAAESDECPNIYPVIVLAISTGMRRGEIRFLTWKEVDLKNGAILLERTKNKERRRVPLRGLAFELVKKRHRARRLDTDFVFWGPMTPATNAPFDLDGAFRRVRGAAGIADFRFHDLRHYAESVIMPRRLGRTD